MAVAQGLWDVAVTLLVTMAVAVAVADSVAVVVAEAVYVTGSGWS